MDFQLLYIVYINVVFIIGKFFVVFMKFDMINSVIGIVVNIYVFRIFVVFFFIDGVDLNRYIILSGFFFNCQNWVLFFGSYCMVDFDFIYGEVESFVIDFRVFSR